MLSYALAPGGVTVRLHYFGAAFDPWSRDSLLQGIDWPFRVDFEDARGSAHADTLLGSGDDNLLLGEDGNDLLRGLGGADTLLGGADADTLTAHLAPATLEGGAGADLFGIVLPGHGWAEDPLATMTRIIDFQVTEGDRLRLVPGYEEAPPDPPHQGGGGFFFPRVPPIAFFSPGEAPGPRGGLPVVWTGTAAGVAPVLGMALPGAALASLAYTLAWLPDPTGGGWLLLDLSGDGQLGAGDRVARLDGEAPSPADFLQGSFRVAQFAGVASALLAGNGLPDPGVNSPYFLISGLNALPTDPLADALVGGAGADTLLGGAGADLLAGGLGADLMIGGSDDDRYVVDHHHDRVVEAEGGGADHIHALVTHALAPHVEFLTLVEAGGAINGAGNELANSLRGNGFANRLGGRAGADTLDGGAGDDSLFGEAGDDLLIGAAGNDLMGGGDGADTLDAGAGSDLLRGGAGNDSLLGGTGTDTLYGGAGADTLESGAADPGSVLLERLGGGSGDDHYVIRNPLAWVVEQDNDGADTITAWSSGSYQLPSHVEFLYARGDAQTIIGNGEDNWIEGDIGSQRLLGGAGADTLTGGFSSDTLVGGRGADLFRFGQDGDTDVILDFKPGEDRVFVPVTRRLAERAAPHDVFDAADLAAALTDTPEGALLALGVVWGSVLFVGLATADLSPSDFLIG